VQAPRLHRAARPAGLRHAGGVARGRLCRGGLSSRACCPAARTEPGCCRAHRTSAYIANAFRDRTTAVTPQSLPDHRLHPPPARSCPPLPAPRPWRPLCTAQNIPASAAGPHHRARRAAARPRSAPRVRGQPTGASGARAACSTMSRWVNGYYAANAAILASYLVLRAHFAWPADSDAPARRSRINSPAELHQWVRGARRGSGGRGAPGQRGPQVAPQPGPAGCAPATAAVAAGPPSAPNPWPPAPLPRRRRPQEKQALAALTAIAAFRVWRRRSWDGVAAQILFYSKASWREGAGAGGAQRARGHAMRGPGSQQLHQQGACGAGKRRPPAGAPHAVRAPSCRPRPRPRPQVVMAMVIFLVDARVFGWYCLMFWGERAGAEGGGQLGAARLAPATATRANLHRWRRRRSPALPSPPAAPPPPARSGLRPAAAAHRRPHAVR
jgi:hypothetical protein